MHRIDRLASFLAGSIQARLNCIESGNAEWEIRHQDNIRELSQFLPAGSGIDNGCTVDTDKSTAEKIIIHTAFHHMAESGMYDGWTDHTITVRPAFTGLQLSISGRNRNDIKTYLYELFDHSLSQKIYIDVHGMRLAETVVSNA